MFASEQQLLWGFCQVPCNWLVDGVGWFLLGMTYITRLHHQARPTHDRKGQGSTTITMLEVLMC